MKNFNQVPRLVPRLHLETTLTKPCNLLSQQHGADGARTRDLSSDSRVQGVGKSRVTPSFAGRNIISPRLLSHQKHPNKCRYSHDNSHGRLTSHTGAHQGLRPGRDLA